MPAAGGDHLRDHAQPPVKGRRAGGVGRRRDRFHARAAALPRQGDEMAVPAAAQPVPLQSPPHGDQMDIGDRLRLGEVAPNGRRPRAHPRG